MRLMFMPGNAPTNFPGLTVDRIGQMPVEEDRDRRSHWAPKPAAWLVRFEDCEDTVTIVLDVENEGEIQDLVLARPGDRFDISAERRFGKIVVRSFRNLSLHGEARS